MAAGVALPGASSKVEGALKRTTHVPAQGGRLVYGTDGLLHGVAFDPDRLDDYVKASPCHGAMHKI
jgi:NitT/TauT family transport system ATP-binding protein